MTSELQDRIARAIYEGRNGRGCTPWARLAGAHKRPYVTDALAAMKAMRDPTETMLDHAEWAHEDDGLLDFDPDDFRLHWRAAIDAEIKSADGGEHD